MFPSLYLLTILAQFTESPKPGMHDRAEVARIGQQGEISWSDAEDKVSGSFNPYQVENGKPLEVVVRVGAMEGAPFEGPVTLSLSPQEGGPGDTRTVAINPGPKAWSAQLSTGEPGLYWLEIGFNTSRRKVVRAEVTVIDARLPRWPWYVMTGLGAVLALVLGVRAVIGKKT